MRTIHKGKEPSAWVEFRSRSGASFESVDAPKDELRRALVHEQGGLCCYCLGRIEAGPRTMKIEHWASQSRHPARQLEYNNLLGACLGGQGSPPSAHHCDTAKGDEDIGINPADARRECSALFTYWLTGEIRAATDDPRPARDIQTLALNHPRLRAGRRERIAEVLRAVRRAKGTLSGERLLRMATQFEEPDGSGNLEPFCQAAIFWLRRQARKRGSARA